MKIDSPSSITSREASIRLEWISTRILPGVAVLLLSIPLCQWADSNLPNGIVPAYIIYMMIVIVLWSTYMAVQYAFVGIAQTRKTKDKVSIDDSNPHEEDGQASVFLLYDEITRLLEERKSPYKAIVAFSGTKEYGGRTLTEADVNGFPSKDIEENMEHDPYRILVVADKFQTGYDQPLLHTMYVDKVLTDVKAVQTLSRLNRCHPKKRDTFVLDFCNDVEDIQKSFQRFYKTTILSKETDPNKLNDLIAEIESANIYTEEEVKALNEKYWAAEPREMLDPIVNKAVERFKWLDENDKIRTKSSIKSFLRTYTFIAAVMPYKSIEWEMLNTYYSLLVHKLPVLKDEDLTKGLIDAIDFDQYRLIKNEEQKIELENKDSEIDPIPVGNPKGGKEPDMQKLSDILDEFNKINWTNIEVVKQQLDELPTRLQSDVTFVNAVKNSNRETAMQQCASSMMAIVAGMLNENTEFCRYYLDHPDFMNAINQRVFSYVYDQLNQESKAGESHPNTKYVFPGNDEVKFSIAAEDK